MKFSKPALPLSDQLQLWQKRGLEISSADEALHYLQFIGYYRLSAYTLPYQDLTHPEKHFKPAVKFSDVLSLYVFDRELRLLVMDAIERIEVAVRSCLMNHMCIQYGGHWFMETKHFKQPIIGKPWQRNTPGFDHAKFLTRIDELLGIQTGRQQPERPHNEVFVNHYYHKYTDPYLPPAWMVFELFPVGTLSSVFANLKEIKDRKAVSAPLDIDEKLLEQWLLALSYIRNICAHHSRLWNRKMVIKPIVAKKHRNWLLNNDWFYAVAVALWELLQKVAPNTKWNQRLAGLIQEFPTVPIKDMGFSNDWKTNPFWQFAPQTAAPTSP